MKIAYITSGSPYDKNSWSGTNYYVRKSLEDQGHELYCIYDVPNFPLKQLIKAKIASWLKRVYLIDRTIDFSKLWNIKIQNRLQPDTDAILSLGTIPVACLETDIPIFIYVDGIFEQMRTFYKWENIIPSNIKEANSIEQLAINKCAKIISCSLETTKAIEKFYKVSNGKTETIPLGANWDNDPDEDEVRNAILKRVTNVCKILFCGVVWERKGADIVFDAVECLHKKGMNVELHLCGLKEIPVVLPPYVINHGFISKSSEEGINKLRNLFSDSHFLFVPSRAEAYGLVFCEASAFGVPVISHKIGGLTTIVQDGVNGKLFDIGTSPETFAKYIDDTFYNYNRYLELAHSSYHRYKETLNWNVSGKLLSELIEDNCESNK